MKKKLLRTLIPVALSLLMLVTALVPLQNSYAASTTPPGIPLSPRLTITLTPLHFMSPLSAGVPVVATPAFQANALVGGRQPLFGLSVSSLKATLNGKAVPVFMDNFGVITFQHWLLMSNNNIVAVPSTYCVYLTIQYGQGGIPPQTASASSCSGGIIWGQPEPAAGSQK